MMLKTQVISLCTERSKKEMHPESNKHSIWLVNEGQIVWLNKQLQTNWETKS